MRRLIAEVRGGFDRGNWKSKGLFVSPESEEKGDRIEESQPVIPGKN